MNILAIETSCDETAAAVVKDGRHVIGSAVSSQIKLHKPYSGVVPELASRAHVTLVNAVIAQVLQKTKWPPPYSKHIDAIAVTTGPGLVGSLLVGRMTAETLGWVWDKPVIGVNHLEGHLLSPLLHYPDLKPPFLGLVVSGGHTELILAKQWGRYELLGKTRDDAAGEAFDKVAKMMDLGYPGGPVIDRLARQGRAFGTPFPRPWLFGSWDFSFSGLKTAVLYKLREKNQWSAREKKAVCAGFQEAVVHVLVGKTMAAAKMLRLSKVVVGGGVAANSWLRDKFQEQSGPRNIKVYLAPPALCTDNAAMIGAAAYFKKKSKLNGHSQTLNVSSRLPFAAYQGRLPTFTSALVTS